jgi:hypothetical protein
MVACFISEVAQEWFLGAKNCRSGRDIVVAEGISDGLRNRYVKWDPSLH